MLLQVAIDAPEHLALIGRVAPHVDIVEVGTTVLKRFGLSAISTARELAGEVPILADTKTVDGGAFEAEMVFGAGATFMTVLATASPATHRAVDEVAERFGAWAIADTITETGKPRLLPEGAPPFGARTGHVAVHFPSDLRASGETSTVHIDSVQAMHDAGHRVSLAGGIRQEDFARVLDAQPEILVVGSGITGSSDPIGTAKWMHERLIDPDRGWPWERS